MDNDPPTVAYTANLQRVLRNEAVVELCTFAEVVAELKIGEIVTEDGDGENALDATIEDLVDYKARRPALANKDLRPTDDVYDFVENEAALRAYGANLLQRTCNLFAKLLLFYAEFDINDPLPENDLKDAAAAIAQQIAQFFAALFTAYRDARAPLDPNVATYDAFYLQLLSDDVDIEKLRIEQSVRGGLSHLALLYAMLTGDLFSDDVESDSESESESD